MEDGSDKVEARPGCEQRGHTGRIVGRRHFDETDADRLEALGNIALVVGKPPDRGSACRRNPKRVRRKPEPVVSRTGRRVVGPRYSTMDDLLAVEQGLSSPPRVLRMSRRHFDRIRTWFENDAHGRQ